jgi:nitrite reductase (NADH) large subunit
MTETQQKAWICPICGYIHYGALPPEECPVCGAAGEDFEPYAAPEEAERSPLAPSSKIVIVGAGVAGVSAAEAARKASPQSEVVLISNEAHQPYYRMNLTRYLAGELGGDQLDLHPEGWYAENGIQLLCETTMEAFNPANKALTLRSDGGQVSTLAYDKLILAAGARPFLPPLPGTDLRNVTSLRTRADTESILDACRAQKEAVVIGGGLLGLETAGGLLHQGLAVTVLENQAWLLSRQLNRAAGELFLAYIHTLGIRVVTDARIKALLGNGSVDGVQLEDGTILPSGLVIISAGIRSNIDLARQVGLKVNQGILVDDAMATSEPDVFAAGDIAEHRGVVYGIWPPAQVQGIVAGMSAGGQAAQFGGVPRATTLKVLGYEMFSIGVIAPQAVDDRSVEIRDGQNYACLIMRGPQMIGAILLGDVHLSARIKKIVENRQDISNFGSDQDMLAFLEKI